MQLKSIQEISLGLWAGWEFAGEPIQEISLGLWAGWKFAGEPIHVEKSFCWDCYGYAPRIGRSQYKKPNCVIGQQENSGIANTQVRQGVRNLYRASPLTEAQPIRKSGREVEICIGQAHLQRHSQYAGQEGRQKSV